MNNREVRIAWNRINIEAASSEEYQLVEEYIGHLEEKEERLTKIEDKLNKAVDEGNTAVVNYFKEFQS